MNKRIHANRLETLNLSAGTADRGRAHLNIHDSLDAAVQRLFIATTPDTYIRPHRHREAHKWEFFLLLEGAMDLLIFDDGGTIIERSRMSRTDIRAAQIPPGQWHSYICCAGGTLALEVKEGAYIPTAEDDFAPWAPPENTDDTVKFLAWMRTAPVGSSPP